MADPSSIASQPLSSRDIQHRRDMEWGVQGGRHTNLIQLDSIVLCTHLGQERLGGFAVWAVGLGEDSYCTRQHPPII